MNNEPNAVTMVAASEIVPGSNDRTVFDPVALQELADSIKEHGLIQPVTVRLIDETEIYQIVAGERRYRACSQILNWAEVPCIIVDLTDEEAAAVMLAENVARKDLDPIDEARAYKTRMTLYGWTVDDCALRAGVSARRIGDRLTLLSLAEDIQHIIRGGSLKLTHAEILAAANLDTNRQRLAIAKLREAVNPTRGWFKKVVDAYAEQQAQDSMLEICMMDVVQSAAVSDSSAPMPTWGPGMFTGMSAVLASDSKPPHPMTTTPPTLGSTLAEIVKNQAAFWSIAAGQWESLGRTFKKQECQAAAAALQLALQAI